MKKWIKSITDCASNDAEHEDLTTDSDTSVSNSSDSSNVNYRFPYDILNAQEVKALLLNYVGSLAISTGQVPGPVPNPAKADKRRTVLRWLDEHPEILRARSDQEEEDKPL